MKRTMNILSFVVLMMLNQAGWSATGNLFTITGSGTVVTLDITLCLNGKGPLTCQNYTVTRETLSIRTVALNKTYPDVGIKIRTPGYTPSGCSLSSNGYCLFSVSDTTPASITATSTATSITLTSIAPTSGTASGGTGFTLTGNNLTGATAVTFGGTAATIVNVVNATTVTGVTPAHAAGAVDVVITTPQGTATLTGGYTYLTTAIGQSSGGGVIACLGGAPYLNLIAATSDNSDGIRWYNGVFTATGATSSDNGLANTNTIVSSQGADVTSYAAGVCSQYENAGYTDWFLPAKDQLNCLYTNRTALATAGAGFSAALYWSSTEGVAVFAWGQFFDDGFQDNDVESDTLRVRCVRAFTP